MRNHTFYSIAIVVVHCLPYQIKGISNFQGKKIKKPYTMKLQIQCFTAALLSLRFAVLGFTFTSPKSLLLGVSLYYYICRKTDFQLILLWSLHCFGYVYIVSNHFDRRERLCLKLMKRQFQTQFRGNPGRKFHLRQLPSKLLPS